MAQKRHKTSVTRCEDEYAVSQQREALSAKANTGKFLGLRAEKHVKPNSAKTAKPVGRIKQPSTVGRSSLSARKRIPPSARMVGVDP